MATKKLNEYHEQRKRKNEMSNNLNNIVLINLII